MKSPTLHGLIATLILTTAIGALFSWPLPLHLRSAVPAAHYRPPHETLRAMVPGDHLQLLYHFWLASDMLAGGTPLFHNLYEFNLGDDAARREPGAYYAPFSLVYAGLAAVGGRALAWNLTGWLSLWLTAWFTWHLAARYTEHEPLRLLAAVVSLVVPFRWISLLGGSPTGFAMAWVPLLALGLDRAVADGSVRGGAAAAFALVASACGDAHTFFFAALSIPLWGLLPLIRTGLPCPGNVIAWIRSRGPAFAVVAIGGMLALALASWTAADIEAAERMERSLSEVALFSPRPAGLFAHRNVGISNQITLGFALVALLGVSWIALVRAGRAQRPIRVRAWGLAALFAVSLAGIILLALGPWGPYGGIFLRAARRLVPPYRFIRQAAKVMALFPTLAAGLVASAGWRSWGSREYRSPLGLWRAVAIAAGLLIGEALPLMRPHLCRLVDEQAAYAAVAEDGRPDASAPRALVLPLWPGNSHYASVYQYYASLHRVRLVNGYRPFVSASYRRDVFERLESLNQGWVTDEQIDWLLARGIHHILFHEDLFPEQVSPFPAAATLARLFSHPRLSFVRRDGAVYAFRLKPAGESPTAAPEWCAEFRGHFPAWRWPAQSLQTSGPATLRTQDGSVWVTLGGEAARAEARRDLRVARFPGMCWQLRLRGRGSIRFSEGPGGTPTLVGSTSGDRWEWVDAPSLLPPGLHAVRPSVDRLRGTVDLASIWLYGDVPAPPKPGETVGWPAFWFFRAGWSEPEQGLVHLVPGLAPADEVFYGPRTLIPAGEYETALVMWSDAPDGATVGVLRIEENPELAPLTVRAGETPRLRFSRREQMPFTLRFLFLGRAAVRLQRVELTRLPNP